MKEEKVYFKNNHGERLCGVLTVLEDASKKHPLVVLCHGFTSSKDSATYPLMAEKLYDSGILSLRFDFYGHGESEGRFEDITITEGTEEVISAIDFVKTLEYAGNIALFGTSFGGLCATLAASRFNTITALGLKAPASDMIDNRRKHLGEEGYDEWKQMGVAEFNNHSGIVVKLNYSFAEDGEKINAFEEARKISCTTLIVHGDNDLSVPLQQSERLAKGIKNVKLEIIEGANHHFDRPGEKEKINMMFVKFFKEVLT
ncbi:alpha/beta fold hydrolase [Candidatus Woesearchaeota archaeon]|nr:alpha/beta fold hydrolase [Candidatus Woesearchaeota archaeon]